MLHHTLTIQKFAGAQLPPRTVVAIASDDSVDRDGDIVVASGVDLTNYRRNNVVLRDHDRARPVAKADVSVEGSRLKAVIRFPAEGVSQEADETFALVKSGILSALSIGFSPIEWTPIAGGGRRYEKWELLELSIVAVPSNPNALIVQRSLKAGAKSGRAISASNREHVAAVRSHLAAMRDTHERALAAHAEHGKVLKEMGRQLAVAEAHAAALEAAGGDADERAARIAEAKALLSQRSASDDSVFRRLFPPAPEAFKALDPARQVRVIATHEGALSNGERVLISGADVDDFNHTRGVCLAHDHNQVVAYCAELDVMSDRIEATIQIPKGAAGDELLARCKSGELGAASVGYSVLKRRKGADGSPEVTKWTLREITLCPKGGNALARVLSVGGVPVTKREPWQIDPDAPRMPTLEECGSDSARYQAAIRRFEQIQRQWAGHRNAPGG